MDNEMIERVALAISGGSDPANILAMHRNRAISAVKSMREPTDRMIVAGLDLGPDKSAVDYWEALIEAVVGVP